MAKYLFNGVYTEDGVKGLMQEGGSGREKAVAGMMEVAGGKLDGLYFGVDGYSVYGIVDLPDNVTGAALGMAIKASGMVDVDITCLLTTAEIDKATRKTVHYRPPGS